MKILSNGSARVQNLLSSMPIRNAPSANAAKKLPLPESDPVTAYSLTKACEDTDDFS